MLPLPESLSRQLRTHWVQWLPWVVGTVVALAAVMLTARWLVDRQLVANGEEEGENWVEFVQQAVPSLEQGLRTGRFDAQATGTLRLMSTADEVFRFRLFDAQGRLVVDSRAIGQEVAGPPQAHPDGAEARAVIADGAERVTAHHDGEQGVHHYSVAMVPIVVEGRRIGAFQVHIDQSERAEQIETAFLVLCGLVVLLTLALGGTAAWRGLRELQAKLLTEERVRFLASHDALSGTLNRASFTELLSAAAWRRQAGGPGFAVLCIDLDRFKEVNDTHGHAAGDELLRVVGERLRSLLRHGDGVARLGGDEFAVMQSGAHAPQDVARLGQRILDLLAEPLELTSGASLLAAGSVGAAIFDPAQGDVQVLLKQADAALYQAKAEGRGCFRFYDAELDEAMRQRRHLLRDLRGALERDELHLEFQPLFDRDGVTLRGYEALMRWTSPVHGSVPPSRFVPLAEENGLIAELGAWALQRACRQAMSWPAPLSAAVNLSAVQFDRGDLVATVRAALADSGLAPQRLELEITESLLIGNTQRVLDVLTRLRALGVRVAMDDFGTGYSSLAYLWRFPFDKIKIDRAFIRDLAIDPKVDLIVRSIIDLAHAMRIRVTGEGVETDDQLRTLASLGCDEVQGFLLGRPAVQPEASPVAKQAGASTHAAEATTA